ncbi:MAG: nucleotidyltransferase domain-containing protein [Synergistaceae bacterium]|nr:nucleotidyltransferase domain-containing protein [Synergistaceae bacterium]
MTQDEMNILVPEKLNEIERERGITVLYAAESGSRAWGFESPDSDFDVRFIYKRPQSEYLRLDKTRDVIELPINDTWDVSGWDLDKALRLLMRSNPTLYEWLSSPICYRDAGFSGRMRPLLAEYFSPSKMLWHYLSMARNNMRALDGDTVRLKRYLYILRPLLACLWVTENESAPPVKFADLAESMLPDSLRPELEYLLAEKVKSSEKAEIPRIPSIDSFAVSTADKIQAHIESLHEHSRTWDAINAFFLREISQ